MSHPIHRVRSFEIVAPYTLRVRFEDDAEQTIDLRPVLAGELYGPLRDLEMFNQVRIDPDVETLVWPNGADFDRTLGFQSGFYRRNRRVLDLLHVEQQRT